MDMEGAAHHRAAPLHVCFDDTLKEEIVREPQELPPVSQTYNLRIALLLPSSYSTRGSGDWGFSSRGGYVESRSAASAGTTVMHPQVALAR